MVDDQTELSPGDVMLAVFAAWRARDHARTVSLFADDAAYIMMLPTDIVPFGGETRGRASISDRLAMILACFDTIDFTGRITKVVGDLVYAHTHYWYRHKLTGETIDAGFGIEARVRDGQVTELKEFHDLEKVRAFMRLVAYRAASDPG